MKALHLFMTLGLVLGYGINGSAQSADDSFDSSGYDVYISAYNWDTNTQPADPLTTNEEYAGTYWTTFAFSRDGNIYMPSTGFMEFPIVGTITSTKPVNKNYGRIAIHLSYLTIDWRDQYPHSAYMKIATDSSFGDAVTIQPVRKLSVQGEYLIFDLPERSSRDYYQFCFDVPEGGPQDEWLGVYEIFFYTSSDDLSVDLSEDGKTCTLIANRGDLHVLASEFDKDDNYIGEVNGTKIIAKEEGWENMVAEQGESYMITAPTTPDHYIEIKAKTVLNGVHSPEKMVRLNGTGVSSIETPSISETECVQWFDIYGRSLRAPTKGIVIKRQGIQVSKVIFN